MSSLSREVRGKGVLLVPYFFDINVNGANYLEMFKQIIVPFSLLVTSSEALSNIRFQQDAATPHWNHTMLSSLVVGLFVAQILCHSLPIVQTSVL